MLLRHGDSTFYKDFPQRICQLYLCYNVQPAIIPYTCVVEVCKNADGLIRLYNHEVTPIQTQKPQDVVATSRVSDGEITTRQHQGAMAKVAKDFHNTYTQTKNQQGTKHQRSISESLPPHKSGVI